MKMVTCCNTYVFYSFVSICSTCLFFKGMMLVFCYCNLFSIVVFIGGTRENT